MKTTLRLALCAALLASLAACATRPATSAIEHWLHLPPAGYGED